MAKLKKSKKQVEEVAQETKVAKKRKSNADEPEVAAESPKKKTKKAKKAKIPAPELTGKKVIFEFTSLPRHLDDDKFKAWLNKKVKHIHIMAMRAIWNKSRPACYVDIDAAFQEQVLALYGVSYNGSLIEVKIDEKGPMKNPRTSGEKSEEKDARTIFIKGIPDTCVEDDLSSLEIFAEATAIRIVRDKETNTSRGFGFAEFSTVQQMEACMSNKRQAKVNGKNLFLDKCAKSDEDKSKDSGNRGRGRGAGNSRGRGGFKERASHGKVNSTVVSAKNKGSIQEYKGKRQTFDSDDE